MRIVIRLGLLVIGLILCGAIGLLLMVLDATSGDLANTRTRLSTTAAALSHQEAVNTALTQTNDVLLAETVSVATARNDAIVRGNALNVELVVLSEQYTQLGSEHNVLTAEHDKLQSAHGTLMARHENLTEEHVTLGDDYKVLDQRLQDLEWSMERVDWLENRISTLETELQPLLLSVNSRKKTGFRCTGSMEPTITCLDEATWAPPDTPERIVVGTTISFDPSCWEDAPNGIGTAHRVIDIKIENGETFYWPKGDSNREADGCWVPFSNVDRYIVELHKDVRPENRWLRDKVNAARAARYEARDKRDAARAAWEQVKAEYHEAIERYCGAGVRPGDCRLPSPDYDIVKGIYNRLETLRIEYTLAIAAYKRAYEHWQCWNGIAKKAKPGQLIVPCPPPPTTFPAG